MKVKGGRSVGGCGSVSSRGSQSMISTNWSLCILGFGICSCCGTLLGSQYSKQAHLFPFTRPQIWPLDAMYWIQQP